jgi:superfamily II DNA or RNA helicase
MPRVSQHLASQLSKASRSRGEAYFDSGAVRSLTIEAGVIQASVRGSVTYTVWIETGDSLLGASCTCPYFNDHFVICKHIWAVVLAAEAQSIPLVPEGIPLEEVALEPVDSGEADWSDQDDWELEPPPPFKPSQARARGVPPVWQQALDAIASAAGASGMPAHRGLSPDQLLYVVDVAASEASGALVIELMTRDRKANGDWGKPKMARLMSTDVQNLLDRRERHLLERLMGPRPHLGWTGGWSGYGQELSRVQLQGVLASEIVPLLCETDRCQLRLKPGAGTIATKDLLPASEPIAWDDGPAWTFKVSLRQVDAAFVVEGALTRGDDRMGLSEPVLLVGDQLVFTRTHAARLDTGNASRWLTALRAKGHLEVPLNAREQLIDTLLTAPPPIADAPDDLRVETVLGSPAPHLRIHAVAGRVDRLRVELAFDYEGALIPFESPALGLRVVGSTRAIRRDQEAERRALDLLHARGCRLEWSQESGMRVLHLPSNLLPRVVRQLLDDGWHVEAKGQLYRQPGAMALDVRSGIDWFELHGHVDYGERRASLPQLLAALHKGDGFVTLDDGSIGLLPEDWLQRHSMLASLGAASGDHLRFKRSQATLLDALIAAQPQASWDETFARTRTELRAFDGINAADPPASFTGTLRAYQRDGLGWLQFLQRFGLGGCLADDMGLGKTVMVLALLAARQQELTDATRRPSLVVAPRSLVFNWRQEAARFAPTLRILDYSGGGREALRNTFAEHDVLLTTYGTLRRDASQLSNVAFDYVVLDESQAIKNAATVSAKTTRVLNARHRLALSGTPIENHLGELWSLFEFLNPGLLSTATAFNRAGAGRRVDAATAGMLAQALRPFILRRTKDQVASDLPPKTEQTLYCELERPQRALYDELLAHYRHTLLNGSGGTAAGLGRAKLQVLEALLRLRQAACHPGLIDRGRGSEASAKLDVLVPRLVEATEEGHKTLVFSQFTSLLAILRAQLDALGITYEYLDGRTRDRQSKVERFQSAPDCKLFLISLKAGGLGLNLTAAEYVFLLDPWWNPAVEAQAIDRAHRIGQTSHVFAYRLIARNTVEERVLELQQQKRGLADAILTEDNSLIRNLRREDLELLLS